MKKSIVIPFLNMYYGVIITSILMITIGLLAKFNLIYSDEYNFNNLDSAGFTLFFGGSLILGFNLLLISSEEEE